MIKNIEYLYLFLRFGCPAFSSPLLAFSFLLFTFNSSAQNVSINADGAAPDASAILDLNDTTRGFLPPRLTTNQMNNLSSPAEGLLIYNVDSSTYYFYNNIAWVTIGQANLASGGLFTGNGNVGIGTTTPKFDLEVAGSEGKQISTVDLGTADPINDLVISDTANVVRLTGIVDNVDLTGIVGALEGRIIYLINTTNFDIKLKHDDANSSTGNRFILRDGNDRTLRTLQVTSLIYSPLDGGWMQLSEN